MANVTVSEVELQSVLIDGYPVDISNTESHDFGFEVTEYPVEKGSDIADHVRAKPLKITMDCVVTDTPIGVMRNDPTRKDGSLPSGTIYQRLLALRENPKLIVITTSLDVFEDMLLSDLGIPRESGEPHQLHFKVEFTHVSIVENQRTIVRVQTPGGERALNLGEYLLKNGVSRIYAYTVLTASPETRLSPLVLKSKDGKKEYHIWTAGTQFLPPADGWIDAKGYHSFSAGKDLATYDPATGFWKNSKGQITRVMPIQSTTAQTARDDLEDRMWVDTVTGRGSNTANIAPDADFDPRPQNGIPDQDPINVPKPQIGDPL